MDIVEIIMLVVMLIVGGISLYLKYSKNIADKAVKFIRDAEDMYKDVTKAGGRKFEWVVDQLYAVIPAPLNMFLTRDMVSKIVQNTFDIIEDYAKMQLDKAADKIIDTERKTE